MNLQNIFASRIRFPSCVQQLNLQNMFASTYLLQEYNILHVSSIWTCKTCLLQNMFKKHVYLLFTCCEHPNSWKITNTLIYSKVIHVTTICYNILIDLFLNLLQSLLSYLYVHYQANWSGKKNKLMSWNKFPAQLHPKLCY